MDLKSQIDQLNNVIINQTENIETIKKQLHEANATRRKLLSLNKKADGRGIEGTEMKYLIAFLVVILCCSCARPTFKYNDGQLVKYKSPPMGNKYKVAFVLGFGLENHFQKTVY